MVTLNRAHCVEGGELLELCKEDWGQLTLCILPPGEKARGHSHSDERWWLLQGKAEVTLGDGVVRRFEQDAILWVTADTSYEIHNVGEGDVVFVFWSTTRSK